MVHGDPNGQGGGQGLGGAVALLGQGSICASTRPGTRWPPGSVEALSVDRRVPDVGEHPRGRSGVRQWFASRCLVSKRAKRNSATRRTHVGKAAWVVPEESCRRVFGRYAVASAQPSAVEVGGPTGGRRPRASSCARGLRGKSTTPVPVRGCRGAPWSASAPGCGWEEEIGDTSGTSRQSGHYRGRCNTWDLVWGFIGTGWMGVVGGDLQCRGPVAVDATIGRLGQPSGCASRGRRSEVDGVRAGLRGVQLDKVAVDFCSLRAARALRPPRPDLSRPRPLTPAPRHAPSHRERPRTARPTRHPSLRRPLGRPTRRVMPRCCGS